MTVTKHLVAAGRVQAVGYRQFMMQAAIELKVTGWVRNRADGSVEAILCGESDAVRAMIERARRGPPHARVTQLEVTDGQGRFTHFELRPTV